VSCSFLTLRVEGGRAPIDRLGRPRQANAERLEVLGSGVNKRRLMESIDCHANRPATRVQLRRDLAEPLLALPSIYSGVSLCERAQYCITAVPMASTGD
jgi:hypothetical protein